MGGLVKFFRQRKMVGLILILAGISLLSSLPVIKKDMYPGNGGWVVLCNLLTCFVSWGCFQKIFRDRAVGVLCSVLYTLSIYRLYAMYGRMDMDEVVCMLFLPFIVCGLYGIYEEHGIRKDIFNSTLTIVGMTGMLCTHMLTGVLALIFLTALLPALLRKGFWGKKSLWMVCSVVAALALNVRILWRGVDKLQETIRMLPDLPYRTIQERGLYPAQLFLVFFERGSSRDLAGQGMVEIEAMGIGITLVFPLCAFLFLWLAETECRLEWKVLRMGKAGAVSGGIALILSLCVFPWNMIQSWNRYFAGLIYMLQSPQYFLVIAVVALTVVAGSVCMWVKALGGKKYFGKCIVGGILFAVGTAFFYIGGLIHGVLADI